MDYPLKQQAWRKKLTPVRFAVLSKKVADMPIAGEVWTQGDHPGYLFHDAPDQPTGDCPLINVLARQLKKELHRYACLT